MEKQSCLGISYEHIQIGTRGITSEVDPKEPASSPKAAAAAENSASAFSGAIVRAGHAVAPISSTTGPSAQSGEGPGTHTNTHTLPKPRVENLISLTQESGRWARILPSNAASSLRQEQDGSRTTRPSKKEGKRLQVHTAGLSNKKNAALPHSFPA